MILYDESGFEIGEIPDTPPPAAPTPEMDD